MPPLYDLSVFVSGMAAGIGLVLAAIFLWSVYTLPGTPTRKPMPASPFVMTTLKEYIRTHPPKGFKPLPFYSEIGDYVEWYWRDLPIGAEVAYAEPVIYDDIEVGSVLREDRFDEPVGVKIFGIRALQAHALDVGES